MKRLLDLFIVGIIFFSACKSSETNPTDRVSIGLHQSARLGSGVTIRADSIQDGRCPIGLYCIWAGQARVKLVLSTVGDSSMIQLVLGPDIKVGNRKRLDSTNVSLNNAVYKVILRDVNPYPSYPAKNEPQVAIVQVTEL